MRQMRRIKQMVSEEECRKVLREEKRAAFSVIGEEGYPYTVPVNFYYEEDDNCIYLHGAKTGHKTDAIQNCDKVCFTTWNQGFKREGGWEWNATSVVIFGRARIVQDKEIVADRLRKMAAKYYPSQDEVDREMNGPDINRVQMIAIEIDHMTGKLVNEK
ncbi:MAG: pyridoxamine 5'-phosphate oxidase family protein [Clostridiales bacterium]|nr:pyridoxamine 5'-phosphate oxidase family protein [Clostridiales bacterium]